MLGLRQQEFQHHLNELTSWLNSQTKGNEIINCSLRSRDIK